MQLATKPSTDTVTETVELMIFDLDGTLAESKAPLDQEMADLLCRLLEHTKVAIISGASFGQLNLQFLAYLKCPDAPVGKSLLRHLSLLPANGSSFYRFGYGNMHGEENGSKDEWKLVYQKAFLTSEKIKIREAIESVTKGTEVSIPELTSRGLLYGEQLEDRDSQMTFSAFGQQAPINVKKTWDPDHAKREAIVPQLRMLLPDFEINIGGMTSIDITKKGMDKEHGIDSLVNYLSIPKSNIIYIGDALFPGGNDYGAVTAGVQTYSVKSVSETKNFITNYINSRASQTSN